SHFSFFMTLQPPHSPLFPYTTLFRSDTERMRRNLEASHGLVFSHRLLLALVDSGLPRDDAYRLVQRHAMQAWEEDTDFRALAEADRKSTRLNSSHRTISYAVFCLKKK